MKRAWILSCSWSLISMFHSDVTFHPAATVALWWKTQLSLIIPPILESRCFDSGLQLRPEFTRHGYWRSHLTSLFPHFQCADDRRRHVTGVNTIRSWPGQLAPISAHPGRMAATSHCSTEAVLLLVSQSLVLGCPSQASLRVGRPLALNSSRHSCLQMGSTVQSVWRHSSQSSSFLFKKEKD